MIKFFTDHYFHIGAMHLTSGKPCQDYAISENYDDFASAVVSDGCSSGGHTDVGSRILALSTISAIREYWTVNKDNIDELIPTKLKLNQRIVSAGVCQSLGLQVSDMLATSIYAYITPKGGFVSVQGDGVVALKYRDASIEMFRFEWANNMPYYPAYHINGVDRFIKAHGDDLENLSFSREKCVYKVNSGFGDIEKIDYTTKEGIEGINLEINEKSIQEELEYIAIFSDGVTQIDEVDWKEAVAKLMSFKNVKGEFAKRRMIREIKDVSKNGKGPIDDISYAVVGIGYDE